MRQEQQSEGVANRSVQTTEERKEKNKEIKRKCEGTIAKKIPEFSEESPH